MTHITALVFASKDPERLATFYREVLDIPFEVAQHGSIRPHIECEVDNFHFAIIHKPLASASGSITPSFVVENLPQFVAQLSGRGIKPLHPIIDLGEGKSISTITDPDGNTIRLIQISSS